MGNPDEGQVSFEANGKTWTLEITNRTERELQKRVKRPMGKIVAGLADGDTEDLLAIFIVGLKTHHPDVSEDDATDMIRPKRLRSVVTELLQVTYPADDPEGSANPPVPGQGEAGSAISEPGSASA